MHEMALMGDILNIIIKDAEEKGIKQFSRIDLIVGELSNAMPDALEMAFEVYKDQNAQLFTKDAVLHIQQEEALSECVFCQMVYKPDFKISICPSCQLPSGKLISGETFQVLAYEGE